MTSGCLFVQACQLLVAQDAEALRRSITFTSCGCDVQVAVAVAQRSSTAHPIDVPWTRDKHLRSLPEQEEDSTNHKSETIRG